MEITLFDYKANELSREVLTQGYTKHIDYTEYWYSHGMRSEYEPTSVVFDKPRKFEIVKTIIEYVFDDHSMVVEYWDLFVDGELSKTGETMSYEVLKTKLKLDICIGHD